MTTMMRMLRRTGTVGLLALALIATSGAGIPQTTLPETAFGEAEATVAAVAGPEVQVFTFCKPDGSYSFNAVGHGFSPVSSFTVTSVSTSYWVGGGSTSVTNGHGILHSSASGYITTPTYDSSANSQRETVSVKVRIGGISGTDAANCD